MELPAILSHVQVPESYSFGWVARKSIWRAKIQNWEIGILASKTPLHHWKTSISKIFNRSPEVVHTYASVLCNYGKLGFDNIRNLPTWANFITWKTQRLKKLSELEEILQTFRIDLFGMPRRTINRKAKGRSWERFISTLKLHSFYCFFQKNRMNCRKFYVGNFLIFFYPKKTW